uniref:Uncharacterized protein n=1 Tax=Anopheles merus TaxID=30066 RepID=A0A182VJI1_ANOME
MVSKAKVPCAVIVSSFPSASGIPQQTSAGGGGGTGQAPGSHIPPRYQPPPHPPGGILKNGYTNGGHLKAAYQNGGLAYNGSGKGYFGEHLKKPSNPSRLLAPRQHIRFSNLPPLVNGGPAAPASQPVQSQQAAITVHQQQQQQQQIQTLHHLPPAPHARLSSESSSEDQTTSSTRSLQAHLAHAKAPQPAPASNGPSAGHIHQTTAIVHQSSQPASGGGGRISALEQNRHFQLPTVSPADWTCRLRDTYVAFQAKPVDGPDRRRR